MRGPSGSSRSQTFFEISVLKNFSKFTGIHMCWSEDLKACNFIKKRLQPKCFLVIFAKFLRTTFFTEDLQWLLLTLGSYSKEM